MDSRKMRRGFAVELLRGLQIVWPILSILLALIVVLGVIVGIREGWTVQDSIYFAFVTALTIGYGDFAPTGFLTRMLAILTGACGILVTALIAAVAVRALTLVRERHVE